jgi:hypothetical protein
MTVEQYRTLADAHQAEANRLFVKAMVALWTQALAKPQSGVSEPRLQDARDIRQRRTKAK